MSSHPFLPALLLALAPAVVHAQPSPADGGRAFDAADLRALPRPANIWSLLGEVPGVVVDRVDVGGSETALQSLLVSRGDTGAGATWMIDGIDVTDPAALGSTLVFPDLETLDSVRVRTSALDVRVRTPGVQVALALPAAGDKRFGRAWLSDALDGLQADNLPNTLRDRPFYRNQTRNVFEGAAQVGGPVAGGRGWLWGSASHSRLRQEAFTGHPEELSVTSFTAKASATLGGTHLALLGLRNEKRHQDRDTGFSSAPEARWTQSGPSWLVALEAQHLVKQVALLGRVSWLDAGFRLDPQGGTEDSAYEDFAGVLRNSYYTFSTHRPRLQAVLEATTPLSAWGFDHHLLVGAGYRLSNVSTDLSWPGNEVLGLERQSVFFRTFELTGFALPMRDQSARSRQEELEAYAQDTLRRGRFTFDLGLRLDHVQGRNLASSVAANPEFPELLPAVAYAGGETEIRWTDLLPRAGVTWDLNGNGRRLLFAGYAAYAAALSAGDVVFDNPIGREPASLTYYWRDLDADHVVDRGELDLVRGNVGASGMDPANPGAAVSPHLIAEDLTAPRTHELRGAAAQAMGSWLRVSLETAWRRATFLRWTPLRNLTLADYVIRGAVQGELFGEPYSVGYFAPASESRIVSGNGRVLDNRPRYRQESVAVTLSAAGDWGRRAQARLWAAFTDWREFFEDRALAVQDPTSTDTEPLIDVGPLAVRGSGLGRADVFANARWTGGATVSALVPASLHFAARLQVREGFPIPYFQVGNTGDPTAGAKNVLVAQRLDQYRLPALVLLDLRLARGFGAGPGTLTLALDGFNVLNRSTTLQVARDVELPAFNRPREILRPRIFRIGVEYVF